MLGKITTIGEDNVEVALGEGLAEVKKYLNYHVIFEENNYKVVGEIREVSVDKIKVNLLGEINNGRFLSGVIKKPSLDSACRIINKAELDIILGNNDNLDTKKLYMGKMPLYDNYPINININDFFSHHFSIFGNTGSGKSYSVARILQNIFYNTKAVPKDARIFIFDAYGEYHNAFSKLNIASPDLNFKTYTTNLTFPDTEIL
ncbi:MAG: DUF87 domain-containing protein, partial [Bacilli bacterium]|nr:DUF87 domain-containing protein [Bacilli bacterium]